MITKNCISFLFFILAFYALSAVNSIANLEKISLDDLMVTNDLNIQQDSCDLLVLSGGEEIHVKILEVTENVVKYKKCGVLKSSLYIKTFKEVYKINYANGDERIINPDNDPSNITSENDGDSETEQSAWAKGFIAGAGLTTIGLILSGTFNGLVDVAFLPSALITLISGVSGLIGLSFMKRTKTILAYLKGWILGLVLIFLIFTK